MKNDERENAIYTVVELALRTLDAKQLEQLATDLAHQPIPYLPSEQQPPKRIRKHSTEIGSHAKENRKQTTRTQHRQAQQAPLQVRLLRRA